MHVSVYMYIKSLSLSQAPPQWQIAAQALPRPATYGPPSQSVRPPGLPSVSISNEQMNSRSKWTAPWLVKSDERIHQLRMITRPAIFVRDVIFAWGSHHVGGPNRTSEITRLNQSSVPRLLCFRRWLRIQFSSRLTRWEISRVQIYTILLSF